MTSVTRRDMSRLSPRDRRDAPLKGRHACHGTPGGSTSAASNILHFRGRTALQVMVGSLVPTITLTIARLLQTIGGTPNSSTQSSSKQLPTIVLTAPIIVDDRQVGADDRWTSSTDSRPAVTRFNDRQSAAGAWIEEQAMTTTVDGPTAAAAFVCWAAEHGIADEWKVDDVWYITSEDFAPANNIQLPPRRVFLGALKKTPGVICTPNRRVYDRNGNLRGKTTFYRLPKTPEVRAAGESPALRAVKHAA